MNLGSILILVAVNPPPSREINLPASLAISMVAGSLRAPLNDIRQGVVERSRRGASSGSCTVFNETRSSVSRPTSATASFAGSCVRRTAIPSSS